MLNRYQDLPKHRVQCALPVFAGPGDDVAASIREAFGASITRILAELKTVGVLQKDVAARMDIHSAQISRWKDGMIPTADVLDEFIAVANKALPPAKRIEPSDLFGDPQRRQADFVVELARRAGYEVKKP